MNEAAMRRSTSAKFKSDFAEDLAERASAGMKIKRVSREDLLSGGCKSNKRRKCKKSKVKPPRQGPETPDAVKRAFTMKGAVCTWSILHGFKNVENRVFRLPLGWIAIHVGRTKDRGAAQYANLIHEDYPTQSVPKEKDLYDKWAGYIVGLVHVREHRTVAECNRSKWANGKVCNIIDRVVRLKTPIKAKGALSTWELSTTMSRKIKEEPLRELVVDTSNLDA